jgi:hypothetical protein
METGGKEVSGLLIKRGMAQAFRSPQGNFGRRPADALVREPSIRTSLPDRRSGLTFSGIGSQNMGLTFIYRKRAVDDLTLPCGAPDSQLAVGGRLINPGRFDKTQARRADPNRAMERSSLYRPNKSDFPVTKEKPDRRAGRRSKLPA